MCQTKDLPSNIPNPGPREAADFPVEWVWSAYWVLCSLQKGNAYKITLLFFLAREVITCGADQLVLGNPLGGSSPTSSFVGPSYSRGPYQLLKGNWGGEGGQEGIHLLP